MPASRHAHKTAFVLVAALSLGLSACAGQGGATQNAARTPPPASAKPVPSLASLTGASPDAVRAALGAPSFSRTEPGLPGAEVWQYGGGGCLLFVYFYTEPPEHTHQRSAHLDARAASGGPLDVKTCVARIAQAAPATS